MHEKGHPSNYLFQVSLKLSGQMFDHVYGACIADPFIKYRFDRYTY